MSNLIPFAELMPGAVVRVTDDKLIWAVDLVMAVTGQDRNCAGRILRELDEKTFSQQKLLTKQMPGKGNANTRLVSFTHSLELIMVLPGNTAKALRVKACDILKRYFAGDATLVKEIEDNAASSAPLNVMAREAMASDAIAASAPSAQVILAAVTDQVAPAVVATKNATTLALSAEDKAAHYEHMSYEMRGHLGAEGARAAKRMRMKRDAERALRVAAEKMVAELRAAAEKRDAELLAAAGRREATLLELVKSVLAVQQRAQNVVE